MSLDSLCNYTSHRETAPSRRCWSCMVAAASWTTTGPGRVAWSAGATPRWSSTVSGHATYAGSARTWISSRLPCARWTPTTPRFTCALCPTSRPTGRHRWLLKRWRGDPLGRDRRTHSCRTRRPLVSGGSRLLPAMLGRDDPGAVCHGRTDPGRQGRHLDSGRPLPQDGCGEGQSSASARHQGLFRCRPRLRQWRPAHALRFRPHDWRQSRSGGRFVRDDEGLPRCAAQGEVGTSPEKCRIIDGLVYSECRQRTLQPGEAIK
jgi:hypothetical protein